MRIDLLRVLALLLSLALAGSAVAIDFNLESMLSPGPLSSAHAKYEGECKKCHGDSKNKSEVQLCLNCHKPVGQDIEARKGFHGLTPGVTSSECRLCHSEHQGRKADILQFNPSTFQHAHTDFALDGKHKDVPCGQCHKNDAPSKTKPYRDTPQQCNACHQNNDVHKGSQGKECQQCHSTSSWSKTTFDHSKTAFPLLDKHSKLECSQCHRSSDYKDFSKLDFAPPKADKHCASCHQIDDVHLGRFGQQCNDCHNSQAWNKTRFNHTLDTHFELKGAHRSLTCTACHSGSIAVDKTPATCNGCHQGDDVHKGRNGSDCQQCHSVTQWKTTRFDHSKTGFLLKGAHQQVACEQCHAGDVKTPIEDQSCNGCHASADAHQRALGSRCEQCHSEQDWRENIRFDHDLSAFPLLGAHATVGCEACHADSHFRGTPQGCHECHQKDPHKQAFGKQCESCHHPIGWMQWQFDHDRQTDFSLSGKHKGLTCEACHSAEKHAGDKLTAQCGSCHVSDDIHRGAYGAQCDTCHSTSDFSAIQPR